MSERLQAFDEFAAQLGRPGRLSSDEDHELRRLHLLRRFGAVAGRLAWRYDELRSRDRRRLVREPVDEAVPRTPAT